LFIEIHTKFLQHREDVVQLELDERVYPPKSAIPKPKTVHARSNLVGVRQTIPAVQSDRNLSSTSPISSIQGKTITAKRSPMTILQKTSTWSDSKSCFISSVSNKFFLYHSLFFCSVSDIDFCMYSPSSSCGRSLDFFVFIIYTPHPDRDTNQQ
jgi:hypothetical protein